MITIDASALTERIKRLRSYIRELPYEQLRGYEMATNDVLGIISDLVGEQLY